MIVHRWAGLTIAAFVVIAGLTGAVIAWEEPLTLATRPSLARAAPPWPGATPLDGVTLAERVERQLGVDVAFVPLAVPADHVVRLFVTARPGRPALAYDVVWAEPYSGAVRLTYRFGGVRDGPENIVPFLYALHYGFVAGPWGVWVFGAAALVWTVDCFVGCYVTWPVRRVAVPPRSPSWLARWRPAWRVRAARGYKLTFDLHRAGGLWLWPLLLIFAWSAVGLALPQVTTPVMRLFGASEDYRPPVPPRPLARPPVDRRQAVATGMRALRAIAAAEAFTVVRAEGLSYDAVSGTYRLFARTSLDHSDDGGQTTLWLDARTGRALRLDPPLGRTRADAVMQWLYLLHMAEIGGTAYRLAVSLIGLLVAGLAVTGVLVWQRKRGAQRATRTRRGVLPASRFVDPTIAPPPRRPASLG